MPDLSDTVAKCRIGTAKFFTLLLLLYHTSINAQGFLCRENRHLIRILSSRIIKSSATYALIINVYDKLDPSVFTEGSGAIALKTVYQNAFL